MFLECRVYGSLDQVAWITAEDSEGSLELELHRAMLWSRGFLKYRKLFNIVQSRLKQSSTQAKVRK